MRSLLIERLQPAMFSFGQGLHGLEHLAEPCAAVVDIFTARGIIGEIAVIKDQGVVQASDLVCERDCLERAVIHVVGHAFANGLGVRVAVLRFPHEHLMPDRADGAEAAIAGVEGALPGDTLAVHLLKVRTNRSTAHQGARINAHAVTAAYLVGAEYDPAVTGEWTLLPEKGIAVPTHPSEHMKNYSVPLKPMLGCISVAPAGDQQYRGGDLGPFGGNMDYNDNVEGTTLYFPVFHAGALLGMSDGHAAMGDREVTGSALETSMDVDFSVDVIKDNASVQPRAETKDYLISFGISGSVLESIQLSTSQLAIWIKKDYKLSDSEVAILFASTLKYDITELVDSKYHVVAKIPKSILSSMK